MNIFFMGSTTQANPKSYNIICLSWDSKRNYAGNINNKKVRDPLRCEYSYPPIKHVIKRKQTNSSLCIIHK